MSEFKVNTITNRNGNHGPQVCGITTFGSSGMTLPSGPTEFRGGNGSGGIRGRGLFAGGETPRLNVIDKIEIATTGNATDFGDLVETATNIGGAGNAIRGLFFAGETPSLVNTIQFVIMSSQGGSNHFGDLSFGKIGHNGAVANSTRAVTAGGYTDPGYSSKIEFVTIMTTGDANDFGDLTIPKYAMGSFSSPTRGVFCGGDPGTSPNTTDDIDFIEITTLGNAQDFGDLITKRLNAGGAASQTRGLAMGGRDIPAGGLDNAEYVTIASKGNSILFGDLIGQSSKCTAVSNSIRGVEGGGSTSANDMCFVTIATLGDAVDFGDLTTSRASLGSVCDAHGGLAQ
jgi:hypothetical protein